MSQTQEDIRDFRHTLSTVLSIARRRRWAFLIPGCLGMLAALLMTFSYPRVYVARNMFERRDSVVLTSLFTTYYKNPASFNNLRKSLYVDMKGFKAVENAFEQLGLDKDLPRDPNGDLTAEAKRTKQAMISDISSRCEVYLTDQTETMDIITMQLPHRDPAVAKAILSTLRDNYIQSTQQRITEFLDKAKEYYAGQIEELRKVVLEKESELVKFRSQTAGADPADPESIVHRLTALTVQREDLARRIGEFETEKRINEAALGKPSGTPEGHATTQPKVLSVRVEAPPSKPNPLYAEQQRKIQYLLTQILERKLTMTEEHPDVRRLRMKVAQAEQELALIPAEIPSEGTSGTPGATVGGSASTVEDQIRRAEQYRLETSQKNVEQQLAKARHDQELIGKQIARYESERGAIFERRQEYLRRQEDLTAVNASLKGQVGRYNATVEILNVEKTRRGVTFTILEETNVSPKPVSPSLNRLMTTSGGFGIALGLAIALLLELLDRTFRSAHQISTVLQLPVLQTIGEIISPAVKRRRMLRQIAMHATATILVALVALTSAMVYLSLEKPRVFETIMTSSETQAKHILGLAP